jgi:hypothetical protein
LLRVDTNPTLSETILFLCFQLFSDTNVGSRGHWRAMPLIPCLVIASGVPRKQAQLGHVGSLERHAGDGRTHVANQHALHRAGYSCEPWTLRKQRGNRCETRSSERSCVRVGCARRSGPESDTESVWRHLNDSSNARSASAGRFRARSSSPRSSRIGQSRFSMATCFSVPSSRILDSLTLAI